MVVHRWHALILWDQQWFWILAWFLSTDGVKADYNGGSLNSVNGENLVNSVHLVSRTARITKCPSPHKQVSRSWTKTAVEKKKNRILCFIKIPLPRESIIHKQYLACRVAKDLMWYRKTFTHFHHIMHLTLDPHKRRAEHQSPSVHSPLHSGPYCKCSCP